MHPRQPQKLEIKCLFKIHSCLKNRNLDNVHFLPPLIKKIIKDYQITKRREDRENVIPRMLVSHMKEDASVRLMIMRNLLDFCKEMDKTVSTMFRH